MILLVLLVFVVGTIEGGIGSVGYDDGIEGGRIVGKVRVEVGL